MVLAIGWRIGFGRVTIFVDCALGFLVGSITGQQWPGDSVPGFLLNRCGFVPWPTYDQAFLGSVIPSGYRQPSSRALRFQVRKT
jgi:hypothetical protein